MSVDSAPLRLIATTTAKAALSATATRVRIRTGSGIRDLARALAVLAAGIGGGAACGRDR